MFEIFRRFLRFIEELLEDIRGFIAGNGGLTITVVSGPTDITNCGAAEYQVRFSVSDLTKSGWIIQHVKFESTVTACDDSPKVPNTPNGLEYWEGWEVSGGKVWVGTASSGSEHKADTFRTVDEGLNSKGTSAIRGDVRFIEGFNLTQPPWGSTVPQAGSLPTITPPSEPTGWSDVGTDDHELIVTWVCCGGEEDQNTWTEDGPSLIQVILDIFRKLFGRGRGGEGDPPPREIEEFPPSVGDAMDLLHSLPAWSDLAQDATEDRRAFLAGIAELQHRDTQILRDVVRGYRMRQEASPGGYDVAAMSRLYVLNRVLFDVPERVDVPMRRFGSFTGVPVRDGSVDELWPLSVGASGNLELPGRFQGYFGESYLAVEEFDYFAETFQRREGQIG